MAKKVLNAGFTGEVADTDTPTAKAKQAIAHARDEAGLVAAHAADHPVATGSAVLTVGLVGLAVGYLLGSASASRHRPWRY